MFWREPKDRSSDFCLWLTNIKDFASKTKHTVKLADLSSAVMPVPHGEKLPVPRAQENLTSSDDNSDSDEDRGLHEGDNVDCYPTFEAICSSSEP
jgi:hypothetical protein